ncbi:MAG: glycosyltransferase family 39 protein [Chloroflexota bacterium]
MPGIAVVAALARFLWLELWPPFVDEGIHASAALAMQRAFWPEALLLTSSAQPFKPPLPFLVHAAITPSPELAIWTGRALSAAAGVVSTLLCGALGGRVGGPHAGMLAAGLYALAPLAVLHERLVIQDGVMAAFCLAAALVGWNAVERGSWWRAVAAAMLGGLAVQFKIPALLGAALPLVAFGGGRERTPRRLGVAALAAAGPVLSMGALWLTPIGEGVMRQNRGRVSAPLAYTGEAYVHFIDWVGTYLPFGLWLLPLAGLVVLWRRDRPAFLVCAAGVLLWTLPWLTAARFSPSRYYLPVVAWLCALAAVALVALWRGHARLGLSATLAVGAVWAAHTGWLIWGHSTAPMPWLDDWQYRSAWPSGYGYAEAGQLARRTAVPGDSIIFAIDNRHQVAAGMHAPPVGVTVVDASGSINRALSGLRGTAYFVVDDGRDGAPGARAADLRSRVPELEPLGRFTRPGTSFGVDVLRLRR